MKNKGPGRAYYALPPQPGALFGREKDVAKVVACLEGKGRVVVVTGGPGEGKLAVASQALKQLYEQKKAVGGVWHCNLTGVTHEEGMLIRQAFRKGLASLSPVTCRRTSLCSAPLLLGLCRELPSPVFNDVSPPPSPALHHRCPGSLVRGLTKLIKGIDLKEGIQSSFHARLKEMGAHSTLVRYIVHTMH